MEYEKQWASIDEQVELLVKNKGLKVDDTDELRRSLLRIGYYQLSAYWFSYKTLNAEGQTVFREGTSFNGIMRACKFDRDLRLVIFSAIADIEIYFRSRLSYLAAEEDGSFGFPESTKARLNREYSAAKKSEQFIKHFVAKYGEEHDLPPYWMMVECATMGTIELLYQKASPNVRAKPPPSSASGFRAQELAFGAARREKRVLPSFAHLEQDLGRARDPQELERLRSIQWEDIRRPLGALLPARCD